MIPGMKSFFVHKLRFLCGDGALDRGGGGWYCCERCGRPVREGLGRVVLSVVGLGWLGRKAMVLPREILSTARIQAASIVSLRGSAGLDRGGSERYWHTSYPRQQRYRPRVGHLSTGEESQIEAKVYGITL